jgi:hypothetical protein
MGRSGAVPGRRYDMPNGRDQCGDRKTTCPIRGNLNRQGGGWKSPSGEQTTLKDVKYEGRSGNVYENKGPNDNLPDKKDDICAWSHGILHKNTRISRELSAFLRLLEHWKTNPLQRNVETRGADHRICGPRPFRTRRRNRTRSPRDSRESTAGEYSCV